MNLFDLVCMHAHHIPSSSITILVDVRVLFLCSDEAKDLREALERARGDVEALKNER